MTNRREFLRTAAAGIAVAAALRSASSDSLIEVLIDEPIATIAPQIYGHFVENLGGVVYDGIWVGEDSAVPNVGGIRKQLVEALRRISPPVIRWPGGCFADSYDWHDGIGPRDKRPKRTNFWAGAQEWPKNARRTGPQSYDPNQFGTVEFARFCKLTGAQPYFAANVRGLRPQDFDHWVEYCNSPAGTTTMAEQRAADGERDPLNVRYWGVGNEAWGCGGNFTPEDYATEFLRFTAWVPGYNVPLSFVGSGPNGNDIDWTRRFFAKVAQKGEIGRLWGWSMHHYAWNASGGRTSDWSAGKGDALQFDSEQYYEILREAGRMESFITSQWGVMGETDPRHSVKLVVDEWGAWYAPGTEPFAEALLGQQNTMRDAVLAGITLDTFNRHADKVGMAAVAQLVNNLQSLFFAHEDKFCVTPTYHVFDMYTAHQGGQSLRTLLSAPSISYARSAGTGTVPGLYCSASLREKRLVLTVTNPGLEQTREAEIGVRGARVTAAQVVTLAAPDVHAHNTFDNPRAVEPHAGQIEASGATLTHRFPPASVTKLELALA
ncbi:MAG: alpha-L-arabinofuranosidase C-terminal domain-containing protein [Bryobacteraceae bacterium]|jgi:alpha-N-arabinofuranosidase